MAIIKPTYTEPKGYFNADMLKAAKEFEKNKKAAEVKTDTKKKK